jgi:hypothetical protein
VIPVLVKTKGVSSGQGSAAVAYVMRMGTNEHVEILDRNPEDMLAADEFAQLCEQGTGLIHTTISPGMYGMSDDQDDYVIACIKAEYGIPQDTPHMLVSHTSPRKDGTVQIHKHMLAIAQTEQGNVINLFRSKKRDELISRVAEIELGHDIVPGRHNDWVHEKMMERGLERHAVAMEPYKDIVAVARYGEKQNKRAARLGFNIDYFTKELASIKEMDRDVQPTALAKLIDQFDGCGIEAGEKRSRILLSHPSGEKPYNINKILGLKAKDTADFIIQTQENIDGLRRDNAEGRGHGSPDPVGGSDDIGGTVPLKNQTCRQAMETRTRRHLARIRSVGAVLVVGRRNQFQLRGPPTKLLMIQMASRLRNRLWQGRSPD